MKYAALMPVEIVTALQAVYQTKADDVEERRKLRAFIKAFEEKIAELREVHADFKEKLEAKDADTLKKWFGFLESDFEIPLLPFEFCDKVKNLSLAEEDAVKCCFEAEKPK